MKVNFPIRFNFETVITLNWMSVLPGLNVLSGLTKMIYSIAIFVINAIKSFNLECEAEKTAFISQRDVALKEAGMGFIQMIPLIGNIATLLLYATCSPYFDADGYYEYRLDKDQLLF